MIEVSPKELYDFLSSKGFKYFFHANTVRTSCTLIHQKGLLSRGEIAKRELPMTAQLSDDIDKEFDENMKNDSIQKKMFTIHNTAKRIPFKKYLVEIILDDPAVEVDGVELYPIAKQALASSLNEEGFSTDLLKMRICNNCFCKDNYSSQISTDELQKLFNP
ncbi:MAG: hypothetical protein HDR05_07130 [Lachnospiraceae bacterium]|nr:hypothetical protein [Lachnospiraceae bacterium]